jgi:very-short-patch-repair endonuclease
MRNPDTIARAKHHRAGPTSAEEKLWAVLRSRRYRDIKFRRQHAIGPYVVDFACASARLVLEVDGPSHARPVIFPRKSGRGLRGPSLGLGR